MAIALHYAARSDVGLVRQENQDSGYAGPHLLVVADGMGGHAAGDVASSIAIGEMVGLDADSPGADEALDLLAAALRAANSELREAVQRNSDLRGMGTTVTALLRTGNKIAVAHIGDSRAYLLRNGSFTQITHDHSFVQSLIDEGRITEEEAEGHPQRSLVTRVLTGSPDDEPDLAMREAHIGDRFLLCSDGLSGFVARDTIEEILEQAQPPGATADALVGLAMRAGAPDNVTCIIGDIIDLDKNRAPSTAQEVVGAAAERRIMTTRAMPVSPAAKAAALSRQALGADVDGVDQVARAGDGNGRHSEDCCVDVVGGDLLAESGDVGLRGGVASLLPLLHEHGDRNGREDPDDDHDDEELDQREALILLVHGLADARDHVRSPSCAV